MKTNALKVEREEALELAAWAELHAHYECNDDYDDWVAKCTRIAEALRQLAALRETPESSTGPEVHLPKLEQSFDKDLVYDCGPIGWKKNGARKLSS